MDVRSRHVYVCVHVTCVLVCRCRDSFCRLYTAHVSLYVLQALFFDRGTELRVFEHAGSIGIAPRVLGCAPLHEFDPVAAARDRAGTPAPTLGSTARVLLCMGVRTCACVWMCVPRVCICVPLSLFHAWLDGALHTCLRCVIACAFVGGAVCRRWGRGGGEIGRWCTFFQ